MQRGRRDGINQQLLAAGEQAEPTAAAEGHGDAEGIQRDGPVQAVVHRPGASHTEKLRPEVAHDVDAVNGTGPTTLAAAARRVADLLPPAGCPRRPSPRQCVGTTARSCSGW